MEHSRTHETKPIPFRSISLLTTNVILIVGYDEKSLREMDNFVDIQFSCNADLVAFLRRTMYLACILLADSSELQEMRFSQSKPLS